MSEKCYFRKGQTAKVIIAIGPIAVSGGSLHSHESAFEVAIKSSSPSGIDTIKLLHFRTDAFVVNWSKDLHQGTANNVAN